MNRNIKISLLFSIIMGIASAQSTIQGTVTDINGNVLAGANVLIDGTSVGAAAAADGSYRIDIGPGTIGGQTVALIASYIGHSSQTVNVDVPTSGLVTQNFSIAVDAIRLKAISVTALGFETDRDKQGYTNVSITPADMTRSGEALIMNS